MYSINLAFTPGRPHKSRRPTTLPRHLLTLPLLPLKLRPLLKRRVLLLVAIDILPAPDEQLRARRDHLAGARVDKRLGERGHDGRVVHDKGWVAALGLDDVFGEGVEEAREEGWRGEGGDLGVCGRGCVWCCWVWCGCRCRRVGRRRNRNRRQRNRMISKHHKQLLHRRRLVQVRHLPAERLLERLDKVQPRDRIAEINVQVRHVRKLVLLARLECLLQTAEDGLRCCHELFQIEQRLVELADCKFRVVRQIDSCDACLAELGVQDDI